MDQRRGVKQLDDAPETDGAGPVPMAKVSSEEHEDRPKALPAGECHVATELTHQHNRRTAQLTDDLRLACDTLIADQLADALPEFALQGEAQRVIEDEVTGN